MSGLLKKLFSVKTLSDLMKRPESGEIILKIDSDAEEATVDMSWVEDQILKMKTLCDQVAKKHDLPPSNIGLDGREFYGYIFPGQTTDKCPVCKHEFGRYLQRATTCPECGNYLRVRYGYLLSDADEKRALDIRRLVNTLWRYREIEPDQMRRCAEIGLDDLVRQSIEEFSEKISPYL